MSAIDSAPAFKYMIESEKSSAINEMLINICGITGWTVPSDEMLLVFINQMNIKISESFYYMNVSEILYAFRTYGSQVKNWGSSMSVVLINQVIDLYKEERDRVVKTVINAVDAKQLPPPQKMTESDWEEFESMIRESFLTGKLKKQMLPIILYDHLFETGKITFDKKEIWEQSKINRVCYLKNEVEMRRMTNVEASISIDYILSGSRYTAHAEYSRLVIESKQLSLCKYFTNK